MTYLSCGLWWVWYYYTLALTWSALLSAPVLSVFLRNEWECVMQNVVEFHTLEISIYNPAKSIIHQLFYIVINQNSRKISSSSSVVVTLTVQAVLVHSDDKLFAKNGKNIKNNNIILNCLLVASWKNILLYEKLTKTALSPCALMLRLIVLQGQLESVCFLWWTCKTTPFFWSEHNSV